MLNELYYSTPVCTVVGVHSEGILCGSVSSIDDASTETFKNLETFEELGQEVNSGKYNIFFR